MLKNEQCMVASQRTELMMVSHILVKGSKLTNSWFRALYRHASGIHQVHKRCDADYILRQCSAAIEETSHARLQHLAYMSKL